MERPVLRYALAVVVGSLAAPRAAAQTPAGVDFRSAAVTFSPVRAAAGEGVDVAGSVQSVGRPFLGNVVVAIYLSGDDALDATDIEVYRGSAFISSALPIPFRALISTPSLPPGDYYLLVVPNPDDQPPETNRANNDGASATTLRIDGPDIEVTDLDCGTVAYWGKRHRCRIGLSNAEPEPAVDFRYAHIIQDRGARLGFRVYLSEPLTLPARSSLDRVTEFRLPSAATLTQPTSFLGIADILGAVGETNESNNVRGQPIRFEDPLPDLTAEILRVPAVAAPYEELEVQRLLRNFGPSAASAFEYAYALYTTNQPGSMSYTLSTLTASLPSGLEFGGFGANPQADPAWDEGRDRFVVPGTVPPGVYYLGIAADPNALVAELDENNNESIGPRMTIVPPAVTFLTSILPAAAVGEPYREQVRARANGPITWSILRGSLPRGVLATEAQREGFRLSGTLAGVPTEVGIYPFTVRAVTQDGAGDLELRVVVTDGTDAFSVLDTELPPAWVDRPYTASLTAVGGTPPYLWRQVGPLPSGLTLKPTGQLSGRPEVVGAYPVSVQVSDAAGQVFGWGAVLSVRNPGDTLRIDAAALPEAVIGEPYCAGPRVVRLQAQQAWGAIRWSALVVPEGMTLSADGALCGTPERLGVLNLWVRATDESGASDEALLYLTVRDPGTCGIATFSLPAAVLGEDYRAELSTAHCLPPLRWSIQDGRGDLPRGLTLSSEGLLFGVPTAPGDFAFVAELFAAGVPRRRQPLSVRVAAAESRVAPDGCRCGRPSPSSRGWGWGLATAVLMPLIRGRRRARRSSKSKPDRSDRPSA